MNDRESFYRNTVSELIPDKDASVLVCGGGSVDRDVLRDAGFRNVLISNLDSRMAAEDFLPYEWKSENATALSFPDASFDFVITHDSIHHSSSPHRMLTEMYRVSRKAVLAFEARDSFTMRIIERLGLTQTYEHAAVYYNDCAYGGVDNTHIPNYIYRWTEREIEKTIRSFDPRFEHTMIFRYGTALPCTPELENGASTKTRLLKVVRPFFSLFVKLAPKQQNLFAFYIEKPSGGNCLNPWLTYDEKVDEVRFDRDWAEKRYKERS